MTRAVKAVVWLLAIELFVRSIDYLTGDTYSTGQIEDNLSMPVVWGATGLAAVTVVLFGLLLKKPFVVQTGSLIPFAIYVMFAFQIFEMRMLPHPWPPEDTRLVASHLTFAGLWLTTAITIWWREYIAKRKKEELDRKVRGE